MKKAMAGLMASVFLFIVSGCASIMQGTTQSIGIGSTPPGAKVMIDNTEKGVTPLVVNLSRKDNHTVVIDLPGYEKYSATFTRSTSGWVWGNIVFGGLIGLAIDAISGGMYKLTPTQVEAVMQKSGTTLLYNKDRIIVAVVLQPEKDWQKVGQLTTKN